MSEARRLGVSGMTTRMVWGRGRLLACLPACFCDPADGDYPPMLRRCFLGSCCLPLHGRADLPFNCGGGDDDIGPDVEVAAVVSQRRASRASSSSGRDGTRALARRILAVPAD